MTETSIETKRQYLGAIEDLADRLRRDLELAVSKAQPVEMTPDLEHVPTPEQRIGGLEKVLKAAEVALRTAAEEREKDRRHIEGLQAMNERLREIINKHEGDLIDLNRHVSKLNGALVEERRRVDFLDGKLQERDKQVEALQFELKQTKLQLTDRDDAIESLVKRIGAIRHAADLTAEWP